MAIAKITATEFETELQEAVLDRNPDLDVTVGPIRDTVIAPTAGVLEEQNDRIRRLSLLLSLLNVGEFSEQELDETAFNEEIIRSVGSRAVTTVFFQTRTAPVVDIVVPINFPLATVIDPTLNRAINFRTTETRTLPAATAALYLNAATGFYELEVAVQALAIGVDGDVGVGRITQLQASLPGFESVTNRVAAINGRDRETNEELAQRLLVAIPGTDISSRFGIEREVRDQYVDVLDVLTVFGIDLLLTRAASNAGAVDAYIIGETSQTQTDTQTFLGVGQPIILTRQPVLSVASVSTGGPAFVQGVDYVLSNDTGVNAGSIRGQDAVVFIAGGAAPAIGATLTIVYNYNSLLQTLQDGFIVPDNLVFGRDLLFKQGTQIDIEIAANLSVLAGINATSTISQVVSSIVTFINSLGLGDDVEMSDVNAEVRKIPGVDNLVFTLFHILGSAAGVADVAIERSQYARISSTNVTITLV